LNSILFYIMYVPSRPVTDTVQCILRIVGGGVQTGETEVPGENLFQRNFVHHKSHLTRPGIKPVPPRWEASD
jgi:hypothetical protein